MYRKQPKGGSAQKSTHKFKWETILLPQKEIIDLKGKWEVLTQMFESERGFESEQLLVMKERMALHQIHFCCTEGLHSPPLFECRVQSNTNIRSLNLFPFFLHSSYFLHPYFGSDSHVWHVSESSKKGCPPPKVQLWVKILKEIFLRTKYHQSFMHVTHNYRVRIHPSQNAEKNNCYRSLHIRQLGINGPRKLEI